MLVATIAKNNAIDTADAIDSMTTGDSLEH